MITATKMIHTQNLRWEPSWRAEKKPSFFPGKKIKGHFRKSSFPVLSPASAGKACIGLSAQSPYPKSSLRGPTSQRRWNRDSVFNTQTLALSFDPLTRFW